MGAESPDDESLALLETYASTGLGQSKLLENTKFGRWEISATLHCGPMCKPPGCVDLLRS